MCVLLANKFQKQSIEEVTFSEDYGMVGLVVGRA